MDSFVLLKFLAHLVLPPAFMAAGLVVALLLALFGRRRLAWVAAIVAVGHTLLLSIPAVGDVLMESLQREARAQSAVAKPCCYDAIVLLGGAIAPAMPPELPYPQLTDSADRIWEAARLYRAGIAPRIIASGGAFPAEGGPPAMSEAEAMRIFLVDLGVPASAVVEEGESRNTIQNILYVRRLVGDKPVALVTSAYHMPRAMRLACRLGLNASAFPTAWIGGAESRPSWENWLPTVNALSTSSVALWELMALAFDRRGPGGPS